MQFDRTYLRALVIAGLLGLPVAVAAVAFTSSIHGLESLVWHEIPDVLDWSEPPWWFVMLVPALAAIPVALSFKLPGGGGHGPLDGLAFGPVPITFVPSILIAGIASLALGPVVGPEAPLLALGLALGSFAGQVLGRADNDMQLLTVAGAFAAAATVFAGPFPVAMMLFELIAVAGAVSIAAVIWLLAPGLLSAGVGMMVFTGIADWPGVHQLQLGIPGLPDYETIRITDALWAIPIAVAVTFITAGVGTAAAKLAGVAAARPPLPVLAVAGLTVGASAVLFKAIAGEPVELVLFSGQAATATVALNTSVGVLAAVMVFKAVAFAVSVGAGFRGGMIFPAVLIAIAFGALCAEVLPGLDVTPAVLAATAAASAAALRAPFFGAVLATLLAGSLAADVAPITVLAAVVAWQATTLLPAPPAEEAPA
ncbi:MAG TPA: chloride channel protein [Baekduia sp.]|nr:chloride channel protein [Baekduia sp.]